MEKKIFVTLRRYSLIVLMSLSVILTGCSFSDIGESFIPTPGDYKIHLTSDYEVFMANSESIVIVNQQEGSHVFDNPTKARKISKVGCDENFIVARQDMYINQKEDNNEGYYWIRDINNETSYGPYAYDEYLEKREELGVPDEVELINLDEYKKDYSMDIKRITLSLSGPFCTYFNNKSGVSI